MIAEGPAANRPPHIWFEPSLSECILPKLSSRSAKSVILFAPLLAATFTLAACDRQSPQPAQGTGDGAASEAATGGDAQPGGFNGRLDIENRGTPLPDFTITDINGKTLNLVSLKGKPVLINLWATWCGPCVLEMPMLDKMAGDGEKGLRVVIVSQDMQGAAKVAPFFAEKKFAHLEPWIDAKNDLGFKYNTGELPTSVLYDANGKEVWRMIGAHDWSNPRTDALLADVLGK
jgi:thiol-disulfide isomerase/thioredoxin